MLATTVPTAASSAPHRVLLRPWLSPLPVPSRAAPHKHITDQAPRSSRSSARPWPTPCILQNPYSWARSADRPQHVVAERGLKLPPGAERIVNGFFERSHTGDGRTRMSRCRRTVHGPGTAIRCAAALRARRSCADFTDDLMAVEPTLQRPLTLALESGATIATSSQPAHPSHAPRNRHAMRPLSTPSKTLLALSLAAAFGGFAATAMRDGLQAPAQAAPASAATVPMVAALPAVGRRPGAAVAGADAGAGDAGGGQRAHQAARAGQPVRQRSDASAACSRSCRRSASTSRSARA